VSLPALSLSDHPLSAEASSEGWRLCLRPNRPNSLGHDVPVGESSSSTSDELDMSAFRDGIANALVS
jgi:hypothetical protein